MLRGHLGLLSGMQIHVEGELTMRVLVHEAGGDPEEWEMTMVRVGPWKYACSQAAFDKVKAVVPEA